MPVSATKNKKSEILIKEMFYKAFPKEKIDDIIELTEGYFNVAYKVIAGKHSYILKIAPSADTQVMTYEKNIMFSEVDSLNMIKRKTNVPVPKVLFYDNSHTICDTDYFFMETLEGVSFSSVMDSMAQEDKEKVYFYTGKYTEMMNKITGNKFGYYGQKNRQGDNWYTVFRSMVVDVYHDAIRKDIFIPVTKERLLKILDEEKEIFEEVKTPKFVHWDVWAGNVFIHRGEVSGLIDFERCLWADELMEVGFRSYEYQKAFFEGYGIKDLSKNQKRRVLWYDVYLFLLCSLECDYRLYDDMDTYDWSCRMLLEWVEEKLENHMYYKKCLL